MKETQEVLKKIEVEGISGGNAVKVIMNGDGELKKITFSDTSHKEPKEIKFKIINTIVKERALSYYPPRSEKVLNLISESIAVITATRLYEGQPTFLCEASLLGVPSVFPKTGGINEFFPDNYMLSFKQFDYEDLKNKLQLLDSNDIRKEIGRENKEFIFKYLHKDKLIDRFNMILDE